MAKQKLKESERPLSSSNRPPSARPERAKYSSVSNDNSLVEVKRKDILDIEPVIEEGTQRTKL